MNTKLFIDDKDGFNCTLKHNLSTYTQEELAHELIEYKKETNIEPSIRIGGEYGEILTTIDLNTAKEFLDKYGSILDQVNMPKGNVVEEVKVNDITLDKPLKEYTILELAKLLMDKKVQTNEQYGVLINSNHYDTVDCVSYDDFINKYGEELKKLGIKEELVQEDNRIRKALLTEEGNFAKYVFKLDRGNIGSEGLDNNKLADIALMENEYTEVFAKKDSLDFSNEKEVYDWLVSLSKYINTHAVNLGSNSVLYLLAILKEHGYTSNLNVDAGGYKYEIAFKLKQLENYEFFVCDKVYSEYDSNQTILEAAKLEKAYFEERIDFYTRKIGKVDSKVEELNSDVEEELKKEGNHENLIKARDKELERLSEVKATLENRRSAFEKLLSELKVKYNLPEDVVEETTEEELSNTKKLRLLDKFKDAISTIDVQKEEVAPAVEEEYEFDITYPENDVLNNFTPIRSCNFSTKQQVLELCQDLRGDRSLEGAISNEIAEIFFVLI